MQDDFGIKKGTWYQPTLQPVTCPLVDQMV